MSRGKQRKREKIKKLLDSHIVELREDLNIRLFCEAEAENLIQGQILWIEDITLTEVVYQQNRKKFVLGRILAVWKQKINAWFYNCILSLQKDKKNKTT